MIPDHIDNNFGVLINAAKVPKRLCVLECQHKETGETVFAVCAVEYKLDGTVAIHPLAQMFDTDPMEFLEPTPNSPIQVVEEPPAKPASNLEH